MERTRYAAEENGYLIAFCWGGQRFSTSKWKFMWKREKVIA
jgi:hypothetical protein